MDLENTHLIDELQRIIKEELKELRRDIGITNVITRAMANRRYGKHYISKWLKNGLKEHAWAGKTKRLFVDEIERMAAKDRLFQNKIKAGKKKNYS